MQVGDLVKVIYDGKARLVTKIEVRRSHGLNRMITWAYLLGEQYRVHKDHLEVFSASR